MAHTAIKSKAFRHASVLLMLLLLTLPLAAQAYPDLLYYQFNETSGATTANLAVPGAGHNAGRFSAAPNWNTSTPRLGAASMNNAGLGRHLDTGYSLSERNGLSFTLEFWFRTSDPGSPFTVMVSDGASISIHLVNGGLTWEFGSSSWSVGGNYANNAWHYTGLVYNGATNQMRLHWNGSNATVPAGSTVFSARTLQLLHHQGQRNFHGEIDEFRLWSSARSVFEINSSRISQLSHYDLQVTGPDASFIPNNGTYRLVRAPLNVQGNYVFTVHNTGTQNLVTNGGNPPGVNSEVNCIVSVQTLPNRGGPIRPGDSRSFVLQVTPLAPDFSFVVRIPNNRMPTPYDFHVVGIAETHRPELLYYRFNAGTGSVARNDASPGRGAAPASFSAAPDWNIVDPRLPGAAIYTPGTQRLLTAFSAGADLPRGEFTLEFWMRSTAASGVQAMLGDGVSFSVQLAAGQLQVSAGGHTESVPGIYNDGVWRHVAITTAPGSYGLRVYRDGALALEVVNFSFAFANAELIASADGTAMHYNGELDELRLWAYARSQAEINADRNHELVGRLDVQRPAANSIAHGGIDDAGAALFGTAVSLLYTLRNVGGRPLAFTAPAVAISAEANCNVTVLSQPSGATLTPAAQTSAQLEVAALAPGPYSFTLEFMSDDVDAMPYSISVSGVALTYGHLSVDLGPVDYGSANPGNVSSNSPVQHTLSNTGETSLTISSIQIVGAHASDWTLPGLPAFPVVLGPGGFLQVSGELVPTAVGAREARIRVLSDTDGVPGTPTEIEVFGMGTQGVLSTFLGPVDYGFSNVGNVSNNSPVTHTITNTGSGPLTISAITLLGADSAEWSNPPAPPLPHVLQPNDSLLLDLSFTPGTVGIRAATLRVTSDSGASIGTHTDIALIGEGTIGVLSIDPGPVDYGSAVVGNPSSNSPVTHTINNTGSGPLTISAITLLGANSADWSNPPAPPLPVVLPPAGTLQLSMTLTPSAAGPRVATLRLTSDSATGAQTDVAVIGLGEHATSIGAINVGPDHGGPVIVEAQINGPAFTLVNVAVTYSGGTNPGAAYIASASGFAVDGNLIQGVPAGSLLRFAWDAYATERHTTAAYVLTLTPAQNGEPGAPGSSAPFVLSRDGGWAQHANPAASAPGVYSHSMIFDAANDRMISYGGRDVGPPFSDVWSLERGSGDSWRLLSPAGAAPAGRYFAQVVYDAANQRMILFGGLTAGGLAGDLWSLDLTPGQEAWTQLAAVGPSARRNGTFVYDAVRNRALLFGGLNAAPLNELWSLDLTPGLEAWSLLSPSGAEPAARFGHAAVLDAAGDRMIVFGGRDASGDRNDVHQLFLGSASWSGMSPWGSPPTPRFLTAHAWDSVNRSLIVQSGYQGGDIQRDVWRLSLSGAPEWDQLAGDSNAGTGRASGAAAFDASRGHVLFYGGMGSGGLASPNVSVLDVSGSPQFLSSLGSPEHSPEGRWGAVMAFDNTGGRLVLWGGKDISAYFGDVWVKNVQSGVWSRMATSSPRPEARIYAAAALDAVSNRLIIHGGGLPSAALAADLWTLNLNTGVWTQWSNGAGPSARQQHTLVYDSLRNRAVVYGGMTPAISNETWAFDFNTSSWTQIATPAMPPARHGHGAAYDSMNDRMVVLHGRHPVIGRMADVWTLQLEPGFEEWTDRSATIGPVARYNFAYTASANGTAIWMHGGNAGAPSAELWQLDISGAEAAWHEQPLAGSAPLARYHSVACLTPAGRLYAGFGHLDNKAAADLWSIESGNTAAGWTQIGADLAGALVATANAYDPVGRRVIAFGGLGGNVHQTGLWQLDLSGPVAAWSALNASGTAPSARRSASMIYDGSSSPPRMILYGGRTAFSHQSIVNDVWALVLAPGNEHWVQLAPTGTAPAPRTNHNVAIDGMNRMIVYGGISRAGLALGDIFSLDLSTLQWTQLTPGGSQPPARYSAAMVYDAPRNRIVLHGGATPVGNALGDTWALNLSGTPQWSQLAAGGSGPGAVYYAGVVLDQAGQRMILHGGYRHVALAGLYQLDLATDTWTMLPGTVAKPQARWSHIAAWDATGNRMAVAGGYLQGEVAATQQDGSAETWFWGD